MFFCSQVQQLEDVLVIRRSEMTPSDNRFCDAEDTHISTMQASATITQQFSQTTRPQIYMISVIFLWHSDYMQSDSEHNNIE